MKTIVCIAVFLQFTVANFRAGAQAPEQPLYPDGIREIAAGGDWEPSVSTYLPHIVSSPTGQLIVICPGGRL